MKRLAAAAAILLLLAATLTVTAQSRSVFWTRWDVLIDNVDTTNNRFDVTESYEIDFSGEFRFGSVVIPYTNLEDIRSVAVYEDGQALRESCSGQPGTFCVERTEDDELAITYYFFRPIRNDSRRFDISYTVVGALRSYEGGDQLWWTAVPSEHYGFTIGSSTITVQMPPGYAPREGIDPVETYGAPSEISVQGTTIKARAT